MIAFSEFISAAGFELESKAVNEWKPQVDVAFATEFEERFSSLDYHHKAVGLAMIASLDSEHARRLARESASSQDTYLSAIAAGIWEREHAAGRMEAPPSMRPRAYKG